MTSDSNSFQFNLTPKYGYCDDVRLDGQSTNKLIWLVPHVVKHKGDSEILIWRCNWGNVCKSKCLYAVAKGRKEENMFAMENV